MYSWFWHKLPFGVVGKLISTFALMGATLALLWYVVFPWATPLLPFNDVQVGTGAGTGQDPTQPNGNVVISPTPSSVSTDGNGDNPLPYGTSTNDPVPSGSAGKTSGSIVLPGN